MKKLAIMLMAAFMVGTLSVSAEVQVYLVGDENMCASTGEGHYTFGAALEKHFVDNVTVHNHAEAGLSLKSFTDKDGLAWLVKLPKKSVVFLQVGRHDLDMRDSEHYNTHEAFTQRLHELATRCIDKKITLVLCTPLAVPYYKTGLLIDNLGGYDDVMRKVAAYHHLPLLDMSAVTYEWLSGLEFNAVEGYYAELVAPYSMTESGAEEVANMAVNLLKKDAVVAKLIK